MGILFTFVRIRKTLLLNHSAGILLQATYTRQTRQRYIEARCCDAEIVTAGASIIIVF